MVDEQTKQDINEVFGTSNEDWEEVVDTQSDMWQPKDGDILEGVFIKKKENVGDNKSNVYEIQMPGESGEVIGVWGSTVLDGKFDRIAVGSEVRIQFLGMATPKSGGKDYKSFKVFHRKPAMQEA